MTTANIAGGISAFLLFIAVWYLPHDYHTLLKWVTTTAAIWLTVMAGRNNETSWFRFLIPTAVLFNPIVPVHLSKEMWTPVVLLAAVGMYLAGAQVGVKQGEHLAAPEKEPEVTGCLPSR